MADFVTDTLAAIAAAPAPGQQSSNVMGSIGTAISAPDGPTAGESLLSMLDEITGNTQNSQTPEPKATPEQIQSELERTRSFLPERTTGEVIKDTALTLGATVPAFGGAIGSLAASGAGAVVQYLSPEDSMAQDIGSLISDYGVELAGATTETVEAIKSYQSITQRRNNALTAQIGEQQAIINEEQYAADLAAGENEYLAGAKNIGRDFLNFGDRTLSDPSQIGEVVANAAGSVMTGSILAKAGEKVAIGLIEKFGIEGVKAGILKAGGSALGMGLSEAASTYASTAADIMAMKPGELAATSQLYNDLIVQGIPAEQAQKQVADIAGLDAFKRQLPSAMAFGLVSAKFNANPLSVMGGENPLGVLVTAGKEALEEAGQGSSGQFNQNLAEQRFVDPAQSLIESVGEQAAAGAIGGIGSAGIMGIPSAISGSAEMAKNAVEESAQNRNFVAGMGEQITAQRARDLLVSDPDQAARNVFTDPKKPSDPVGDVYAEARQGAKDAASDLINSVVTNAGPVSKKAAAAAVEGVKTAYEAAKPVVKAAVEVSAPVIKAAVDSSLVQSAKEKISAGVSKTMGVAGPYIEEGKAKVADLANKVSSKVNDEITAAAESSETLTRDWIGNSTETSLPKGITQIIEPAESDTPTDLTGVVAPNTDVLSTVNNVVRGLSDSRISARKLSESAVLYVQAHVEKLRAALPTLPTDVRAQVEKVLTSPQLAYVTERLKDIDMTSAVGKTVADIKRMARLNPGNVNPDEIDRILKQDNKDLTEDDVKNLTAARDIAIALNNHSTRKVRVNQGDEGVSLGAKKTGSDEGLTASQMVSRSIQIDGFEGLPSVGQYASNIMRGGQNPDGMFVDQKGNKTDARKAAKTFEKLTRHMINKVDALNRSHASAAPNSKGKMLGPNLGFESLYKGQSMVPAGDVRAAKTVAYHPGDPGSMKNAQAIHNDAQAAVNVYNTLVERFPDMFPEGKKTLPELVGTMKDITPKETPPQAEAQPAPEAKPKEMGEAKAVEPAKIQLTFNDQLPAAVRKKDQAKADKATKFIGRGSKNSSTTRYGKAFGALANTGKYSAEDVVFISAEGKRNGRVEPNYAEIQLSMDAGATIITDVKKDRERDFNQGEREVANYLDAHGYVETDPGKWVPGSAVAKTDPEAASEAAAKEDTPTAIIEGVSTVVETTEVSDISDGTLMDAEGKVSVVFFHGTNKEFETFNVPEDGVFFITQKSLAEQHSKRDKVNVGKPRVIEANLAFENPLEVEVANDEFLDTYYLQNALKLKTRVSKGNHDGLVIYTADKSRAMAIAYKLEQITQIVQEPQKPDGRASLPDIFRSTFTEKAEEPDFKDARELLDLVSSTVPDSDGFVDFVRQHAGRVAARMNARLNLVTSESNGKTSVLKALRKNPDLIKIKRFKALMFVNPETGKYDPQILSLVVAQVLDYLSGAHPAAPSLLKDRLEEDGILFSSMTEDQQKHYMTSVSIRQTVEGMARKLPELLNLEINQDARLAEIRGSLEGLIKEVFTAVDEVTELIEIQDIPTNTGFTTPAIILTEKLKETQRMIGQNGKQAITTLMGGERTLPVLGKPPETVSQTQNRGGVKLSTTEKEVEKNMQAIKNTLAPVFNLVSTLGRDVFFNLLGGKDAGSIHEDHPYRRSIEGKNLSIQNDFDDAMDIVDSILGFSEDQDTGVFWPVGITRVGRHQMKGPNLQNNKILRILTTPTHSILDMENNQDHKNWFWLTVAQASGLYKAEKHAHEEIYAQTEIKFRAKFGDAIDLVLEYMRTGEIDKEAFIASMDPHRKAGAVTMAQVNAVFAVASLDFAKTKNDPDALQKFETSLSFEIDGLTDGPANMMVHFGQGVLSEQEYENLRRVGLFLGEKGMTTNALYTQQGQQDFYEVTINDAETLMDRIRMKFPEQVGAIERFAARFGDLQVVGDTYQMTRNTAKGPVTKTVYGSAPKGIAIGMSQDMMTEFYKQMIEKVGKSDPAEVLAYPEFHKDFQILFGDKFTLGTDWTQSFLDQSSQDKLITLVENTLAKALSEAAKNNIGTKIRKVNDSLVFVTNVQANFLKLVFESRLQKLIRDLGVGKLEYLPMREYMKLVKEVSALAPSYFNGVQTLSIGSFEGNVSETVEFSDNLEENMRMKSTVLQPGEAGVKVIPYVTQGRGDAMMMNYIFGRNTHPEKSIYVYDGVEIPIDKIGEYSKLINEAVAENWKQDVLKDIVEDFKRFMDSIPESEKPFLEDAFAGVQENQGRSSQARFSGVDSMLPTLEKFAAMNRAFKQAMEETGRSVNHMAGANESLDLGPDNGVSLDEFNDRVREKFANPNPLSEEDLKKAASHFSSLGMSDGKTFLEALARTKMNKRLAALVGVLRAARPDVRVITGSPAQILAHRQNEEVPGASNIYSGQGFYDPLNRTIYLMSMDHETLVHELVHFTTFALVRDVYEGQGTAQQKDAVKRLEVLMADFLEMDFSKASKAAQRAAKTAKGEILRAQGMNDTYGQAKALNEFMAWSLANEALGRELNNTVSGAISQMIKKVRALMARILGTVAYDVFNNVLFNTMAILEQDQDSAPPSMEVTVAGKTEEVSVDEDEDLVVLEDWDGNDGGGNNDGGNGGGNGDNGSTNGGSQSPSQDFTNFWIKLLTKKLDEIKTPGRGRKKKLDEAKKYLTNAEQVFDKLLSGGFNFSHEQEQTFKAIHMMLAFEMNLNANSLVAMNKIFTFVTDNLSPGMFAVDGQDKYQAMMDAFGGTKNTQGVSDAIATFFALSQTSLDYRNALDQLPKPEVEGGFKVSSFNEFVASTSAILMRQAVGEIQVGGIEAKETLDALSLSILNQDANREYSVLRGLMSTFDVADRFASGALRKIAEFGESLNRLVPDEQKLLKVATQSVQIATGLFDERRTADFFEAAKLLTHMGTDLSWAIPFQEFVAEIVGTDKNNTNLVAMLDITKKHVAAFRQKYRDKLPIILQGYFQNKPTAEQWSASHSVMGQTDFSSVFELSRSDASFKSFSDGAYRGRQIQNLERTIQRQVSGAMANEILEKAQQLAAYMNDGGAGHQLLANAFAINHFVGDPNNEDLVGVIDKLVTYYAIDGKPQEELDMVTTMYEADPEAMKNLVVYMQALNLEEDRKLQHPPEVPPHLLDEHGEPLYGDPVMKMKLNGHKGYIPNFGSPDIQLTIEDDVHQDLLAKRGFVRVADYKGEDGMSFTSRGIYKTSTRQNGGYAQGVMQSIQNTYRGVNSVTGLTVNGSTSGVVKGLDLVDSYTEDLNNAGMVNDPKEVLIPAWDENGVAFYQRVINPDVIKMHMAPPQNLALMLGVWAGRQIEEKAAEIYNNLLVDELRKIYDSRGAMEDGMFIDIREEARKMNAYNRLTPAQKKTEKKPDAIYADSWNVIPPQTKFYIQQVFPEGFMVRKDQINTALGYAEPSIVDVWTGKTRLSNTTQNVMQAVSNLTLGKLKDGTSAMTILQKGEEAVQNTVSFAKDLIVVRSVIVPYLNSQANVFNLVMRGVANKAIVKGYRETLVEIEQYNQNFTKRMFLETQVQLNREDPNRVAILKDQIQVLDDQDRRMKIWPLLEAGAYKTISEGITDDDFEVLRGGFMELVDRQVEKLPEVAQTIVKNGVLSHDTKIYQLANKAVQYGDFIAKAVYYEHLLSQGKSSKEALALINEEFVNFSTPPGRVRTGLDKLGATWFMTYKIRVMKPALSQIRNNPVRALMVNVLDGDGTNTAQDSNLLTSTLDGRIGYSLGWDMLFNSTGLNPWANMMGW